MTRLMIYEVPKNQFTSVLTLFIEAVPAKPTLEGVFQQSPESHQIPNSLF